MQRPELFLGVDGGGSKTLACLADRDGQVLGAGRAGGSNFQVVGTGRAAEQIQLAVRRALHMAGAEAGQVAAAGYGLCGADRTRDFDTCRRLLADVSPVSAFRLTNDTTIALRAGTQDGVGIGLVAGTGANQIGVNRRGVLHKVGGLARVLGDSGGALDIAEQAVAAAMRGFDGRGAPTILYDRIVGALGLDALEDLIELYFVDSYRVPEIADLAPLVFEAAEQGDAVARDLIAAAGVEAGCCANVILRALFEPGEEVPIVLGGSLWQRARNAVMMEALRSTLDSSYEDVRLGILDVEPALGGVLYALDDHTGRLASPEVRATLRRTYRAPDEESS